MEDRIQQKAEELFFTYGLKSVTMDDIAKGAGISKKTIYQFFRDKNSMVAAIISGLINKQVQFLESSKACSENAVQEIIMISQSVQALARKIKPITLNDIRKYFPESSQVLTNFKEKHLRNTIINNLERGVKEGLYRSDLDTDMICQFCLVQFSSFFQTGSYPVSKFNAGTVISQVTELFLYGICSPRGRNLIQEQFDNK